jgi:hypothetical protein
VTPALLPARRRPATPALPPRGGSPPRPPRGRPPRPSRPPAGRRPVTPARLRAACGAGRRAALAERAPSPPGRAGRRTRATLGRQPTPEAAPQKMRLGIGPARLCPPACLRGHGWRRPRRPLLRPALCSRRRCRGAHQSFSCSSPNRPCAAALPGPRDMPAGLPLFCQRTNARLPRRLPLVRSNALPCAHPCHPLAAARAAPGSRFARGRARRHPARVARRAEQPRLVAGWRCVCRLCLSASRPVCPKASLCRRGRVCSQHGPPPFCDLGDMDTAQPFSGTAPGGWRSRLGPPRGSLALQEGGIGTALVRLAVQQCRAERGGEGAVPGSSRGTRCMR